LTENKANFFKKIIITLVFEKNAIFRKKLSKIEENCDHNIGPWKLDHIGSEIEFSMGAHMYICGVELFVRKDSIPRPSLTKEKLFK
jgi:hypothetical protein